MILEFMEDKIMSKVLEEMKTEEAFANSNRT